MPTMWKATVHAKKKSVKNLLSPHWFCGIHWDNFLVKCDGAEQLIYVHAMWHANGENGEIYGPLYGKPNVRNLN